MSSDLGATVTSSCDIVNPVLSTHITLNTDCNTTSDITNSTLSTSITLTSNCDISSDIISPVAISQVNQVVKTAHWYWGYLNAQQVLVTNS